VLDTEEKFQSSSQAHSFNLRQNYPNPLNPVTTIKYALLKSDFVSLKIFNLKGQEIEELVNTFQPAGDHQITWSAIGLSSGIYYYKLESGNFTSVKKMLLLK
jgi:hypothetical protein